MKRRRLDPTRFWVGFLIFVACLIGLLLQGGQNTQGLPRAEFGDATPLGGHGLRRVMEKLGHRVVRQTDPLSKMPADAKVWLVLDPETGFSRREANLLLDWVRRGGVLVLCLRPDPIFGSSDAPESEGFTALRTNFGLREEFSGPPTLNSGFLPELAPLSPDTVSNYRSGVQKSSGSRRTFATSRAALEISGSPGGTLLRLDGIGQGRVFVAPDALLFTNYALSKADNAILVANLLRAHAPRGTVYFDERKHGDEAVPAESRGLIALLKKPPISYAVLQLGLAGLLFWAFAGRRLGAPVPLPDRSPVTRASQFAGAMGALFLKTNRPGAAAALIGTRFRRRLATRLGLSPAESDLVLAKRAQEVAGIPIEITDRLLLQSRAPATTAGEALRDAQEMERVLRQLEGR